MLVSGIGCVNREAQAQNKRTEKIVKDATRPVRVFEVVSRTVSETLEITGQLATSDDVTIGAKGPGRLVSVLVGDGDAVRAGQVLATQDTTDALSRIRQAQAQVDAARASLNQAATSAKVGPSRSAAGLKSAEAGLRQARVQVEKLRNGSRPEEIAQAEANEAAARSNMDTAAKEFERARELFEAGAVSRQRLDQAQNQFQTAKAQHDAATLAARLVRQGPRAEDIAAAGELVRQAEEAVRSAQSQRRLDPVLDQQVAAARANLDAAVAGLQIQKQALLDAQIRSPLSGRVSGRPAQPGTYLAPGSPVMRLVGAAGVYFEGEVPESGVQAVPPGREVVVRIDALADLEVKGRVEAVNPQGDSVGRLFKARILLLGDTAGAKPGMFARGTIAVRTSSNATVVPASAILREGEGAFVFVVSGDTARKVRVTPGLRQGDLQEVDGVQVGDKVVAAGQTQLADGNKVLIEKAE